MRLKKSKEEILQQIKYVYPHAQFNNGYSNMSDMSPNELKSAIEVYAKTVAKDAVIQAMIILMENIYTDEEFEKDIALTHE